MIQKSNTEITKWHNIHNIPTMLQPSTAEVQDAKIGADLWVRGMVMLSPVNLSRTNHGHLRAHACGRGWLALPHIMQFE